MTQLVKHLDFGSGSQGCELEPPHEALRWAWILSPPLLLLPPHPNMKLIYDTS